MTSSPTARRHSASTRRSLPFVMSSTSSWRPRSARAHARTRGPWWHHDAVQRVRSDGAPGGVDSGMALNPHEHRMWAVIGMYGGQEDNAFYRRAAGG